MKKRISALVLVIALLASTLIGCSSTDTASSSASAADTANAQVTSPGNSQTTTDPATGYTTLIQAVDRDAPSLGPTNGNGAGTDNTRRQAFECLGFMDADVGLQMCVAKEIETVSPGVYDIHLYDYVYDFNGNHLTASDVVFCFDNAIDSGFYSSHFSTVESYAVEDDYTVRLTFSDERIGQLESILCNVAMYTKTAWDQAGDEMATQPVGTKPYKLTDAVSGSYYTYEKTDSYWQTDESLICTGSQSKVDKVTFTVILDTETSAIALERGEIDRPSGVYFADFFNFVDQDFNALPGYNASVAQSNKVFHIVFNCSENSLCGDVNLRKAISYAINTEAIGQNIRGGMVTQSTGALTNPAWMDYDDTKTADTYFPHGVDKAKEYLAKSSYNGETIKFYVQNTGERGTLATLIQAYCSAIGVNVEVVLIETAVFNTMKKDSSGTAFDMFLGYEGATAYYTWSANFELDMNSYDGQNNLLGIHDEKLQQLFDTAASKSSASVANTRALTDYTEEMCYMYALYINKDLVVARDKVTDLVLDYDNNLIAGACTVLPE